MANYFQDPSQSFVPTPVYHPPFEALQNTLATKQQKYDIGLAGVRNAENSVFNAPLTKGENSEVRSQYLQDASKKLKDLSQVDLSIESNQLEAKNVYGNFFKDQDIQNDMVYTQSQRNELGKAETFKPEKGSNQYVDGRNTANMNSGVDKVRNAKRGDLSVYGVRKFVPYSDIAKDMAEQATSSKFAVESVDDKGVVTVKKTNGAASLGNWTTFVDGMMGDRYGDQLRDEATYAKEQGIKKAQYAYALNNNGVQLNDQDAFKYYVEDTFKSQYKYNDKLVADYNAAIATVSSEREKYIKEGVNEDHFQEKLSAYDAHLQDLKEKQIGYGKAKTAYDPKSPEYAENLKSYISNPDGNLYAQIRTQHVYNTATALASNEKVDAPVASAVYVEAHKAEMDRNLTIRDNMKAQDEHDIAQQKINHQYDEDGIAAGSKKGADGKPLTERQQEVIANDQLQYVGQSNNKIQSLTPVQRFDAEQTRLHDAGYNSLLSADGIGGIVSKASGGDISYSNLVDYLSVVNSDRKPGSYTDIEKAVNEKVNKLFTNNGIKLDGTDRYAIGRGIQILAGKYLKDNLGSDKWASEDLGKIASENKLATEAMATYNRNNKIKSNAVIDKLSANPSNKNLVVTRNDGSKDIINADDLAKEIGNVKGDIDEPMNLPKGILSPLGNLGGLFSISTPGTFSAKLFADAFVKGDVSIDKQSNNADHTFGDVNNGIIVRIKDKPPMYINDAKQVALLNNIQSKYGKSADFGKTLSSVNDAVISSLPGFADSDKMGNTYSLQFDPKKQGSERAVKVINEVTQPANFDVPWVNGKMDESDDIKNALSIIKNWGPTNIYKYMNPPQYVTQGSDGRPAVMLSFNPASKAELAAAHIDDATFLKFTSGNGVELPLKDNKSPHLQSLLRPSDGIYIYDQIAKGKDIEASDIEKGLGFDYSIVPNDRNHPTSVKIMVTRQQMDKDGKMQTIKSEPVSISLSDHNPDEIMDYVNALVEQHVATNTSVKKAYDAIPKVKTDTQTANEKWLAEYLKSKQSTK